MEHEEAIIGIWVGLAIAFVIITTIKLAIWRFNPNRKSLSGTFFTADNWVDYVIHLVLTAIFFFYEHDVLGILNPFIEKIDPRLMLKHPHEGGFFFVLVPILVTVVLYPILRKYISKKIQKRVAESELMKKVAPHVHDEFCTH